MPLIQRAGHSVGSHRTRDGGLINDVLAGLAPELKTASVEIVDEKQVEKMARVLGLDLTRVAGNVYERRAERDFWAVRNGKLIRLTGGVSEVDDGESIEAADHTDPQSSLHRILADLEF